MSDKFLDKYRIPSARAAWWDYAQSGIYFVTICTAFREHHFGKIENGQMILSEIGTIAKMEWLKTPSIRPDMNILLDEFVVMPNHIHAIITIGENQYNMHLENQFDNEQMQCGTVETQYDNNIETQYDNVETQCIASLPPTQPQSPPIIGSIIPPANSKFGPQSKNLAAIIRGFKSAVTKQAHEIHADFAWQSRFHDHIIRNEKSFHTIRNYIRNNPSTWEEDSLYS
jgi:REP element-mobilizing transposase RayT